jgi:hypothetical protein
MQQQCTRLGARRVEIENEVAPIKFLKNLSRIMFGLEPGSSPRGPSPTVRAWQKIRVG